MNLDKFLPHLPPHVRPEFLAWLARRDRKNGLREFQAGYDHGWHDGQASHRRIA